MPTNWKYIKKLLEKDFLCEKLRGQITYDLTVYRPAPWYQQHFIMKFEDKVLLDASQPRCEWDKRFIYPTVEFGACQMFAEKVCHQFGEDEISKSSVERITRFTANEVMAYISHYNAVYGVKEIIDAIGVYLHSDIEKISRPKSFSYSRWRYLTGGAASESLRKLRIGTMLDIRFGCGRFFVCGLRRRGCGILGRLCYR